jgi:predicted enzyme related to lactoylglutathione lyase
MSDERYSGRFVWHDLMARDADKGRQFYTELLGWNANEMSGEGWSIHIFSAGDEQVADVVPLDAAHGAPSHWTSYIAVPDADAAVAKATAHGGQVLGAAEDTPYGRIATLVDPGGAMIKVIALPEGGEAPSDAWPPKQGTFCWFELMVPDPAKVTPFYEDIAGWKRVEGMDLGEQGMYWMFKRGEENAAGLMARPPEVPVSSWTPYIAVDDVDAATAKAESLGATVMVPPQDVPGTGRFSMLQDPVGAVIALFTAGPM